MTFQDVFITLESYGVFEIVLPFLLIFSLVFAVLSKIKILGDKNNINSIVALAISMLAIRNFAFTEFLNRFLPNTAMILIVILVFLLLLTMLTGKSELDDFAGYASLFVVLIALVWAVSSDYLGSYGYYGFNDLWYNLDSTTISWIAFIAGVVIVIAISGGFSSAQGGLKIEDIGKSFNRLFRGKP